ncbi:MAG: glycosyltransferase [Chloroflexi bacterium]|nr:glycosyltransferase [Chloroflexota bacterium]
MTLVSGSLPDMTCGVAEYTARLAESLIDAGAAVRVVTTRDDRIRDVGAYPIVQVAERWGLRQLPRILRAILRERPDVVHVQYPSTGYRHGLAPGLLVPILRVIAPRTRVVATVHEYRHTHWLHKAYAAVTMPWAAVIVTPDESQIASMPLIGRRNVVEIPLTSNFRLIPETDAMTPTPRGEDLIIGTWGMLRRDKGIDLALDAFEAVVSHRPARFVIAGDPGADSAYIREIAERIAASPVRDRITLTGRLDEVDLLATIASLDACVLPYRAGLEGNRGTYATAALLGVYTVTTSSTARGFDSPSNTSFVPPGDVNSLVAAILEAQEHPRRRPGDASEQWASIAERHLQVYAGRR